MYQMVFLDGRGNLALEGTVETASKVASSTTIEACDIANLASDPIDTLFAVVP